MNNSFADDKVVLSHEFKYDSMENIELIMETCSVIIPTKNAGDFFAKILQTLRTQEGIEKIEIIVIDSGSTDQTIAIAEEYHSIIKRIKPEHFTHSGARNIGAEIASGKYLVFLTQDALPVSRFWLYQMIKKMETNECVAASCKEIPREKCDLIHRAGIYYHQGKKFLDIEQKDQIRVKQNNENQYEHRINSSLNNVALLTKADVFRKFCFIGNYAEDLAYGVQLSNAGFKIAQLGTIAVIHSHIRPVFYYLKRTYLDVLALNNILIENSQENFEYGKMIAAIEAITYIGSQMISRLKSLELPLSIVEVVKELMNDVGFINYSLVNDKEFNEFFEFLKQIKTTEIDSSDKEIKFLIVQFEYQIANVFDCLSKRQDVLVQQDLDEVEKAISSSLAVSIGKILGTYMAENKNDLVFKKQIHEKIAKGV